jgi:hypothetical protein
MLLNGYTRPAQDSRNNITGKRNQHLTQVIRLRRIFLLHIKPRIGGCIKFG